MRTFTSICLLGAGASVFAVDTAAAQGYFQRDRYEAVQERRQPEFDPVPVRAGSVIVEPALETLVIFDDNALGEDNDAESDTIFRFAPRVNARTDWANHEIAANVNVEHLEYQDLSDESRTNIRGAVRGRLDVNREFSLNARIFGEDLTQTRREVSASQFFENVEYTNIGGSVGADYEAGRVRLSGRVQTAKLDFDDVRTLPSAPVALIDDQDFRDRTENAVIGRASYAVSPDIALFVQGEVNERDYDEDFVQNRDSDGFVLTAGTNFELSSLVRGDLAIGYLEDNPDDPAQQKLSGLALDGRVQWFPTRLTTVTVDGSRRATDPGIDTVSNAITTAYRGRIDHELRRNIVLFGELGYSEQDFENNAVLNDEVTDFGAGATYKLNRNVHLNGYYRYYDRESDGAGRNFEQNVIGIGLTLFP